MHGARIIEGDYNLAEEAHRPVQAVSCLPPGKQAALCFSIDDIHPGKSTDAYEAGGDLGDGALGQLEWLLARHPKLRVTLFVTADWREISPRPTRKLLASIPYVRDRVYLAKRLPKGTMRLDRHPGFVRYLKSLDRAEIGFHGLYHCQKGPRIPVEFQTGSYAETRVALERMMGVFRQAGLDFVRGLCPPGWNAPPALMAALADLGIKFIASARDGITPVSPGAKTCNSGMRGVSLVYPEMVHGGALVHLPANSQANCPIDRARAILDCGGLLSIKAHIVKTAFGHTSCDGLDDTYIHYLDVLLTKLDELYGDVVWWTSMSEIADHLHARHKLLPDLCTASGPS